MKCSNCGSDIPPGFKFCGNCGTKLAPQCPGCGAEVPEGFKFCGQCGTPLQGAAPPPPPPPKEEPPPTPEQGLLQEELKQVTILFGDVSGFTAMSEKLQPEQVRLIMDTCLKQLAKEVKRFGGTVDKFSGDNIMALFGAPVAHEDDPERAVMAAINMQEALTRFAADLEKRTGLSLQMRMGVNTGPVIAGMTGSEQAKDYTVMGDAVNLASRLEHAAEKGKILVGESTYKATRAVIDYHELAPIMVKGKSQPVPIWEVVGTKARPESRRGIRGLESFIVGRDDELARLKQAYATVTERDRPYLVTVLGMAGMGKSRLSVEFEKYVSSLPEPAVVRRGQCLPYGSTVAFLPLAEVIRSECGILDSDAPEMAREKLLAAIQASGSAPDAAGNIRAGRSEDPLQVFERVCFAIGLASEEPFSEMDPKSVKEELFWGLRKFFEKRAAIQPMVLVFDDIHWADPSLLDFIEYLADKSERASLLVLGLSRPDLMDKRPSWGAFKKNFLSLFLEPLDYEGSCRLIGQLLNVENLPERLARAITAKAEGNPFYIEEILRMLIEDGAIIQRDEVWLLTAADAVQARIPDTLQALMAARIDRLQPEEKRVLQEASVMGRVFWEAVLLNLAGSLRGDALDQKLHELEVKELVREHDDSQLPGEDEWSFNHILVREVSYESIPRAKRAEKHTVVARWIEQKAAGRLDGFAEMLAYQWEQAALIDIEMGALLGRNEASSTIRRQAVQYLKLAGDKARHIQSNLEANSLYNRALVILDSLFQEGNVPDFSLQDVQMELLCVHAAVLEELGEYNKAIQQMEMVRERARERGTRGLEGEALRLLGNLYRDKGDLTQAERLARQALDCMEEEDQARNRGETLLLVGKVYHDMGQPGESRRWAESALRVAKEFGDRRLELAVLPLLGNLNLHSGWLDQAEKLYQEAIRLAGDIGDKRVEGSTLYLLGNVDLNSGDLPAAREHLNEAIGLFREMANRRGEAWSTLTLGTAMARSDDFNGGLQMVTRALEICQELGDKWAEPWCLRALGEISMSQGDLPQAESKFQEALSKSQASGDKGILPELYRGLAEVYLGKGETAAALEHAGRAREVVSEDDIYSQATTWRIQGVALMAARQWKDAEECFKSSIGILKDTGFRIELARGYLEFARLMDELKREQEATAMRQKAAELGWTPR